MDFKSNYLKSVPMLADLPEETLATLGRAASEQKFTNGDVLIWENTVGDVLFIIVAGRVDVIKNYQSPTSEVIATRGPGEIVGEMSLVENQPRSATVVARDAVQVISIPFNSFRTIVWGNVSVVREMVLTMNKKLRQAHERQYQNLLRHLKEFIRLQNAFLSIVGAGLGAPVLEPPVTLQTLQQDLNTELDRLDQLKTHVKTLVDHVTLMQPQQKMSVESVDFAVLARSVVADIRSEISQARLALVAEINTEDIRVSGDPRRLTEAMTCLLNRVIKQKIPGQLTVKVWQDAQYAYYQVSDQGERIAADRLEELWDMFAQMSDALRGGEGLSLDLALTRYIARAHGGETWASSSEQGNTFGFKVPKVRKKKPA